MSETVATAYVQVIPTTQNITSSLGELLGAPASEAGDAAGEKAGNSMAGKFKKILVAAGLGLAVKNAIDTVGGMANALAEQGDTIDKTSQKLGVTAEQYQALAFAAEHCGFSTSSYEAATRKLQNSGFDGTLYDFLNSLQSIDDQSERTALAQEMLGERVANEMAAYINGSESMADYMDNLESLGGLMSGESVKAAAAYEDALTDMKTAISGLTMQATATLLPGMTAVMNGVAALVSGDEGGVQQIIDGIGGIASGIAQAVPIVIESIQGIVIAALTNLSENAPEWIERGGEFIGNMAEGFINNLPTVLGALGNIIGQLLVYLVKNAPQFLSKGVALVGQLASGLIRSIPTAVSAIISLAGSVMRSITSYNWGTAGRNVVSGIANGIRNGAISVLNAIKSVCSQSLGAVKSFFGIHSPSTLMRDEIGMNLDKGLALGLLEGSDLVEDAMNKLSNDALGGFETKLNVSATGSTNKTVIEKLDDLIDAVEAGKVIKIGSREFSRVVRDV